MNHGLWSAGTSVWSWISGFSIFNRMNTEESTVEKDRIHLYLHLTYVKRPAATAKKEYHNLVSPIVLSGGRSSDIHNKTMNKARTADEADVNPTAVLRCDSHAQAAPPAMSRTAAAAKYMNRSQFIISQVL